MTTNYLKELIDSGREIEFLFEGKKYSITYGILNGEEVISFCEFYQETTEVRTVDELLEINRNGHTVEEMITKLSSNDVCVF